MAPADAWAPVWGRAESLAWLGYAQLEAGLPEAAKRSLDAALAVDPAYGFVRDLVADGDQLVVSTTDTSSSTSGFPMGGVPGGGMTGGAPPAGGGPQ